MFQYGKNLMEHKEKVSYPKLCDVYSMTSFATRFVLAINDQGTEV
jgi:hypothetical protein